MLYELRDNPAYKRLPRKGRYLRYYLAGFIDGEGTFSVSIKRLSSAKFGWVIDPVFQVYQHEKNLHILQLLRDVFNAGYIKRKSPGSRVYVYSIGERKTLHEKVIPFFNRYKLLSNKWDDFCKFREIIERMQRKEHLTVEGFREIVRIAHSMNETGKQRRYPLKEILSSLGSSETIRQGSPEKGE